MTRPLDYSVERLPDGRIALVVPTGEHPDWGSPIVEHTLTVERARALRDALTTALGEREPCLRCAVRDYMRDPDSFPKVPDDATGAACPRCYCWHAGVACPP